MNKSIENRVKSKNRAKEIDLVQIPVRKKIKDQVAHLKEIEKIVKESINMSHSQKVVDK